MSASLYKRKVRDAGFPWYRCLTLLIFVEHSEGHLVLRSTPEHSSGISKTASSKGDNSSKTPRSAQCPSLDSQKRVSAAASEPDPELYGGATSDAPTAPRKLLFSISASPSMRAESSVGSPWSHCCAASWCVVEYPRTHVAAFTLLHCRVAALTMPCRCDLF